MTVVICLLIAAAVVLAIVSIVRDKKKGKSCSCGCGCADCAMNGACHASHPTDKSAENKTTENESSPDLPESAAEEK